MSELSARYKVGDEVWIDGESCIISAAHDGKWGGVYTIVCRGRIVMSGASESTMEAHAATIAGPPMVVPGWSVPLSAVSALDEPPVNRRAKPRSNSGQRRAAAKRWWIR